MYGNAVYSMNTLLVNEVNHQVESYTPHTDTHCWLKSKVLLKPYRYSYRLNVSFNIGTNMVNSFQYLDRQYGYISIKLNFECVHGVYMSTVYVYEYT